MRDRRLIGIDWGSTRFRAWLLREDGSEVDSIAVESGILTDGADSAEGLSGRLADLLAPWGADAADLIIGVGMIGSRNGVADAGYVTAPVTWDDWAGASIDGGVVAQMPVRLLGGVRWQTAAAVDVMRGEEFLSFAIPSGPDGTLVLPGTHSKWVRASRGAIVDIRTFVTGELFSVWLHSPSFPGSSLSARDQIDDAAFHVGLAIANDVADTMTAMFRVRAEIVTGRQAAAAADEMLSGVLIGREIRAALAAEESVTLIADGTLGERYELAFGHAGVRVHRPAVDLGAAFVRLANTMGWR